MKRRRIIKIVALICSVIFVSNALITSNAFEREKHDEYTENVLFRNFKTISSDEKSEEAINVLECATFLAIDQYNNSGQNELNTLKKYGVKGIPNFVDSINFTSNSHHRRNTHRGWNFSYSNETNRLWQKRKAILVNSAEKVFDFNGNEAQKDSFCALLYYIHILSDHCADKTMNYDTMGVGGRHDDEDIIHELLHHFSILFADQKRTHKYITITSKLKEYDSKFNTIVNSDGGVNNEEKFKLYNDYSNDLLNTLSLYIPELLKNEDFFNKVMYRD